ncbi:type II toxin-antitoxin system PemK/MazF family toxin [Microbacterium sp. ASV49]|uniref:Type II toxin-antitoxin system PemK/MazF family toxin n=1 Tax=Microbacterium candidum TaxID=3041922 RepID=A0ABT7MZ44_9MICO|nr:type II toxin-antitoxin system PemK/MazF family toxin [Microbacterium sp. ASV49]MDL9979728.1 type II toxin-antitoxin system PemK/MazF family toxin [Microbacterium sp. ASV49]
MARGILSSIFSFLFPSRTPARTAAPAPSGGLDTPGRAGAAATVEIDPPGRHALRITYAPVRDAVPDAGEVVWTWVPYAERDGRGKDRPVLVIGRRDADTVYAVKLTSKAHDGQRDFLPIGSGPWDAQGRPSWVDVDQFYLVHRKGMRREAAALDLDRFTRIAAELHRRYGWAVGN